MIKVVGVFVAAGNSEDAGAQDVGERMDHAAWIAAVGDLRSQLPRRVETPLCQRQQRHAAVGGEAAAIEGGDQLLASDGWQREGQSRIVVHGGCGALRLRGRLVSTPNP